MIASAKSASLEVEESDLVELQALEVRIWRDLHEDPEILIVPYPFVLWERQGVALRPLTQACLLHLHERRLQLADVNVLSPSKPFRFLPSLFFGVLPPVPFARVLLSFLFSFPRRGQDQTLVLLHSYQMFPEHAPYVPFQSFSQLRLHAYQKV